MTEECRVFSAPPVILSGPDCATQVGPQARAVGAQSVFLVTDATLMEIGLAEKVLKLLASAGLATDLFAEVEPEPSIHTAARCGEVARQGAYDLIVGLGGGSVMDVAKAAALLVGNPEALDSYFGVDKVPRPGLPTILLPTTSGTGSEVTPNIVLTEGDGKKAGIVSPYAMAEAAIVDPKLVLSAPPLVTAVTGVDALTHAVEAYLSTLATPLTDALALRAISLIAQYLRRAVAQGTHDLEARGGMAYGSLLAGLSFANAKLGVVHAIAMALGGQFQLGHGLANALILPYGMAFNLPTTQDRMANIARALGEEITGLTVEKEAERAVKAVERLIEDVGLPRTLAQVGAATDEAIESVAAEAITNQRLLATNPRAASQEDLRVVLEAAKGG